MSDGRLHPDYSGGVFTVSGVSLNDTNGRWWAYDLGRIVTDETDRGTDLIMPGVAGRRAKPRRFDATRYLLPILFTGWVDFNGDTTIGDVNAQLATTMRVFQQAVVGDPSPGFGDGTRPATYVAADHYVYTGRVHTVRLRRRETARGLWDGDLEIVLPTPWQITPGGGS